MSITPRSRSSFLRQVLNRSCASSVMRHRKQLYLLACVLFFLIFISLTQIEEDCSPVVPHNGSAQESGVWPEPYRRRPEASEERMWPGDDWSAAWAVAEQLRRGRVSELMLSARLRRAMRDHVELNRYGVAFRGRRVLTRSRRQLLCRLRRQLFGLTLDAREPPFSARRWEEMMPSRTLKELYGARLKTCAVVASAGAILHSGLGQDIDAHDAVLRFNGAPTEGFENDVGTKTTIRLVNSQIMVQPKYEFTTSALYRNITLLAWDPSPYNMDLLRWYQEPDSDLFTPYEERRQLDPNEPFYIVHPGYIWRLWDFIQGNTIQDIQPNPPSSGFIGITVMLALCERVDVYEYVPSERQTDLCHYYEDYQDDACTLGAYHPLLYEKMLVRRMSPTSERTLKVKGRLTLQGLRNIKCRP
ncbi:beta-galactoside alpha-2,6-sialyltransferase 2b isoform X2 [Sardina pilchardus]|uniref:beta-galactoside alpha-2,6-sialyltransferase 2b isoform X2 n=1 Tax=Sardina pilchardus TaxID=27697 RepID=UPI002E12019A